MLLIEKRLTKINDEDSKKQEAIALLDLKNRNLECNIKEREADLEVMGEQITALKQKLRCVLFSQV